MTFDEWDHAQTRTKDDSDARREREAVWDAARAPIALAFGNVTALQGLSLEEKAAKCVRTFAALNAVADA